MSIALALLIELAAVVLAVGVLFAGNMRTTGGTVADGRSALAVFVSGTIMAVLVGASHWIGW